MISLALMGVHAPLLIVIAPLIGAALAAAVPNARLSWAVAVLAAGFATWIAFELAGRALLIGAPVPNVQELIALVPDGMGMLAAPLVAASTALVVLAGAALLREFNAGAAPWGFALVLCAGAGWSGGLLARDFVALFVATEMAWLASVGIVALSGERDRGALNGALRMLGAGGVASALMLLGIGLIARGAGTLDIAALATEHIAAPGLTAAGIGLVLLALALKAGVAPLHFWIGAAYGRAGGLAAMVLGILGAVGALAVLLRVAAHASAAPGLSEGVAAGLVALGAVSVLVGSVQAIGSSSLRRLAGYAVAAQAGCILLTAALGSPAAFAAAFVQLVALSAASLALLGGSAALGATSIAMLDGFGRRAPLAGAAITAGAISLMGAPLTIGFLGRWRMIEAGVGAGWWWATGAVIAASLAAVFYGGRLIERLYFRRANSELQGSKDIWRFGVAPALIASIAMVVWAFEPSVLLRAADHAVALVFGTGAP